MRHHGRCVHNQLYTVDLARQRFDGQHTLQSMALLTLSECHFDAPIGRICEAQPTVTFDRRQYEAAAPTSSADTISQQLVAKNAQSLSVCVKAYAGYVDDSALRRPGSVKKFGPSPFLPV